MPNFENIDCDEPEEILGWLYTHVDCPNCDESHEIEGDATGDEFVCPDCGKLLRILGVR